MSWYLIPGSFPVPRASGKSEDVGLRPIPLLLDTDIGMNVDNLLALIMAARVLERLGKSRVPVAAGETSPFSGAEVFWAGYEGQGYGALSKQGLSGVHDSAQQLIAHSLERFGDDLVIVAIGPLANLAEALEPQGRGGRPVPRCVLAMAGQFGDGVPNTNVRSAQKQRDAWPHMAFQWSTWELSSVGRFHSTVRT